MSARIARRSRFFALALCALAAGWGGSELAAGDALFEQHLVAKRWTEAEQIAAQRHAEAPEDPEAAADLARVIVLSNRGERMAEAAQLLEQAVAKRPDAAAWHFYLGRAQGALAGKAGGLGALGLAGKSRRALARALELEPRNFEYAFALNEFYLDAPGIAGGSVERARKVAAAFASVDRDASSMLSCQVLIREGRHGAAVEALQRVQPRGDPLYDVTRRVLLVRAGGGLIEAGRAAEALPVFAGVTKDFPSNAAGHLGYGRARFETGDIAGALAEFAHAAEIDGNPESFFRLGLAQEKAGEVEKAKESYRVSLERRSAGKIADEARRRLAELGG